VPQIRTLRPVLARDGLIHLDRPTHTDWVRNAILVTVLAYVAGIAVNVSVRGLASAGISVTVQAGTALTCLAALGLAHRGLVGRAAAVTLVVVWLELHVSIPLNGAAAVSFIAFPLVVMAVGILWGGRIAFGAAAITSLTLAATVFVSRTLTRTPQAADLEATRLAVTLASLFGAAALVHTATSGGKGAARSGRSTEQRLSDLTAHATDGILAADADGKILAVNPAAELLLGSAEADLRGEPLARLLRGAADGAEERRKVEPLLKRPGGAPVRMRIRSRKGRVAWVDAGIATVSWTDGSSGRQMTLREVTGQRQSEEVQRLLQTQLESSLRLDAVGRLARGVAHDLNNLLTVIGGAAELLLLDDGEDPRGLAQDILDAKTRGAALAERLLSFARREPVQPQPLRLELVVRDVEPLLSRFLSQDVHLDLALDAPTPPVTADRSQLEQIVINLIINAKDAISTHGSIRITVAPPGTSRAWYTTRWSVPDDAVELTVEDDGAGMDRETLSRVFEPFFTTKPQGPGRGLGLATVHGIVGQNGGRLRLLSEPGIGTAVIIEWPAVQAP
jgi:PAS domain S-box-containing protein